MSEKVTKISSWVLTILLVFMLSMSAFLKLSQNDMAIQQASSIGIGASTYLFIGVIEVISLILFLIPRTGIIGTLLLAAYLGGAIATHLQHQQSVIMPVVFQIIVWITAFIRFPELKYRVFKIKN